MYGPIEYDGGLSNKAAAARDRVPLLPQFLSAAIRNDSNPAPALFLNSLSGALTSRKDATALQPSYVFLAGALDRDAQPDLHLRARALALSDRLLYQTGLPISEREVISGGNRKMLEQQIGLLQDSQPGSEASLKARAVVESAMEATMADIETHMAAPLETEEQVYTTAGIYSSFANLNRKVETLSPRMIKWMEEQDRVGFSKLRFSDKAPQMLLEGKFAKYPPIALRLFEPSIIIRGLRDKSAPVKDTSAIASYFADSFASYYWETALQMDIKGPMLPTDSDEGPIKKKTKALPLKYASAEWFFLQEKSIRDLYLQTIPESFSKNQRERAIKRVVQFLALFTNRYPDHEQRSAITEEIKSLVLAAGQEERFQDTFAVLEGDKPGVLIYSPKGELRTKLATSLPEIDRIIAQAAPGSDILHRSSGGVVFTAGEDKNIGSATQESFDSFTLIQSEISEITPWGEVQVVAAEKVPELLTHLAGKRNEVIEEEDVDIFFDEVSALQEGGATAERKQSLFPSLYPLQHRVRALEHVGLVSVDRLGDEVAFVFSAADAGIETDGPTNIILPAQFDEDDNLAVIGADAFFPLSGLHLALTESAVLAGRAVLEGQEALTREQKGEARGMLKDLVPKVKSKQIPQLTFVENPKGTARTEHVLVVPVSGEDKKVAQFTFGD